MLSEGIELGIEVGFEDGFGDIVGLNDTVGCREGNPDGEADG